MGVGLFVICDVWIEERVAMEDCELDLVGLPGRMINIDAGEGWDGG